MRPDSLDERLLWGPGLHPFRCILNVHHGCVHFAREPTILKPQGLPSTQLSARELVKCFTVMHLYISEEGEASAKGEIKLRTDTRPGANGKVEKRKSCGDREIKTPPPPPTQIQVTLDVR